MAMLARLLLFVPAIVAGWFVARDDGRFWVVAFVVAMVFMVVSILASIYMPSLRIRDSKHLPPSG